MSKILFNEYLEGDSCMANVAEASVAPLPNTTQQTDAYDNALNTLTITSTTITTTNSSAPTTFNNFNNFAQPNSSNIYYETCNNSANAAADNFLINSSDLNFNESFMVPKQMNYAYNPNSSISSSSTSSMASSNPSSVYLSPAWYESLNNFNSGFFYPNIYENEYFIPRGKLSELFIFVHLFSCMSACEYDWCCRRVILAKLNPIRFIFNFFVERKLKKEKKNLFI